MRPMSGSRPKRKFVPGTRMTSSMMSASHLKRGSRLRRFCFSSGGRTSQSTSRIFDFGISTFDSTNSADPKSKIADRSALGGSKINLARNPLQHLLVSREFFHEHEQTLDRFAGLVAGEAAANQIDLLQFPWLKEQFLAPSAGEENVDGWINALIADLPIKDHLHVAGAFEFLEDQLIHSTSGFDERSRDNGERARFLGVARGGEKFSRSFHGASVDTAAHGSAATAHGVVKRPSCSGDRVEQNENVLAGFDETLGALDRELRDPRVTFDIAVVRAGHDLGLRTGTAEIGDFLRTLVDEEDDQVHLRMVLHDGIRDVVEQRRLAGARRRNNQTALAHAERRHQIHDPRRVAIRHRLELDLPVRIDRRQLFEWPQPLILRRLVAVDLVEPGQLRPAIPPPGLAVNPHAVAEREAPHDFRRHENIVRGLDEIAFRVAEKTKTL